MSVLKLYQHGDVLIKEVGPEKVRLLRQGRFTNRAVLAEGEATGHAHVLTAEHEVTVYDFNGVTFVTVPPFELATITHEEHGTRTLPPGTYEIDRVREFDPLNEVTRRVYD